MDAKYQERQQIAAQSDKQIDVYKSLIQSHHKLMFMLVTPYTDVNQATDIMQENGLAVSLRIIA